ncbi:MAG: bifunctional diaminohydroxyphosphoribosylaminopyrimidine deaminase/5-amino-6-(5-phosphoribosylamino)uracil reductase RibD [Pseudomonadota bacterium]
MDADRRYMMRAIELARRAEGFTSPNPMVGCVVVKDGAIVGEGFHARPGGDHAEVAALKAAGDAAHGALVYVTLEPCSHFGRTPPCTDALLAAGVSEVVYAVADPNPEAAGGASRLEAEGVKTRSGVCEAEAKALNRFWLHRLASPRPYVVAKFAASLDGRIATRTGQSRWITGEAARARGHDLRQACDAIVVGANTVIADDPTLTARPERDLGGLAARHPLRVVLDSKGRAPIEAKVFDATGDAKTLVAATDLTPASRQARLADRGVETCILPRDDAGRPRLPALLGELAARDVLSLIIEGGPETLGAFFDQGLVDEVWAFISPRIIGGPAPGAITGRGFATLGDARTLADVETERLGEDILVRGRFMKETG